MKKLWAAREDYVRFDPEKHHIAETRERLNRFLPYRRLYGRLTEEELYRLLRDARENHWQALDLSHCGLTRLPRELGDLTELRILYLGKQSMPWGENCLITISDQLLGLKSLQVLHLEDARVQFDWPRAEPPLPSGLLQLSVGSKLLPRLPKALLLPSLRELDVQTHEAEFDPGIFRLKALRVLYLTAPRLREIPEGIGDLRLLEELSIRDTRVTTLPESIGLLSKLQVFRIWNAPLRNLPESLGRLTNLKELALVRTDLGVFPKAIRSLTNLQELVFFGGGVTLVPDWIGSLVQLKLLQLRGLRITSLPDSIGCLGSLHELSVLGSSITSLPDSVGCLSNLRNLDLDFSKLTALPRSIRKLHNLSYLGISDTPLADSLPPEILVQSPQEIFQYLFSKKSGMPQEYFNEAKLLIVGQGSVGKTCLMKRLVYDTYQEEPSTEGIDRVPWIFTRDGMDYQLNVWDFGGQEIYHATHQFFLTRRSLYLFVWDARAEEEYGRIDYWMKTIRSFADDSPILIVVNKCDKDVGRIKRLDIDTLREDYPQILDIRYVSCRDGLGIAELRTLIQDIAVGMPLMRTSWISAWLNVRRELEDLSQRKNYIPYEDYLEICQEQKLSRLEADSLIKYLHDLGAVLYFYEDTALNPWVILSPEWGTKAVYRVMDEQNGLMKDRNGILLHGDLENIWTDSKKYPRGMYAYLLNLMELFQLAFPVTKDAYLVAELLDSRAIRLDWDFPPENTLSFRYRYEILPAGIMTRLIVNLHDYLLDIGGVKQCWTRGAYFVHGTAQALVQLAEGPAVEIRVTGQAPGDMRDLLTIIRSALQTINNRFKKLRITPQIPCPCTPGCKTLFNYQNVLNAEGKTTTIQCHESFAHVDIRKLLYGVETLMNNKDGSVTVINNINPQFNPQFSPVFTNTNTNTNTVSQELHNSISDLLGGINGLKGMVCDPEVKAQCQELSEALGELKNCRNQAEMAESGALYRIWAFLMDCNDPESKTGKVLAGLKSTAAFLGALAGKYNKIAKWIPSLPELPFGEG